MDFPPPLSFSHFSLFLLLQICSVFDLGRALLYFKILTVGTGIPALTHSRVAIQKVLDTPPTERHSISWERNMRVNY